MKDKALGYGVVLSLLLALLIALPGALLAIPLIGIAAILLDMMEH